jgi:hypothetical protein
VPELVRYALSALLSGSALTADLPPIPQSNKEALPPARTLPGGSWRRSCELNTMYDDHGWIDDYRFNYGCRGAASYGAVWDNRKYPSMIVCNNGQKLTL